MLKRVLLAGISALLLGVLGACGNSGPSAEDIAKAYIAHPGAGGGNAGAYARWKVIQCKESGGSAAFQCDFAFQFLENDRTATARFLKSGDRWVISNIVSHE